ncbi:MAG: IS1380 family transposase [Byssovorax sp.]
MRLTRKQVQARTKTLPALRFEDQRMTSYSGMVLFQALFRRLDLKNRLLRSFGRAKGMAYGLHLVFLQVLVHVLVGFRRLRERDYYADDPLLPDVIGVHRLADTSTLTRRLGQADPASVVAARVALRTLVTERLAKEKLSRVTADFDGSVLTTRGRTEGSAIGYNRNRRGARSYYPLLCTIAQTGQFLDFHHRPGNVHDSNGACDFMVDCLSAIHAAVPTAQIETRIDSAFFDIKILKKLDERRVEFSVSVPFERFPELKGIIEKIASFRWVDIDERWSYAEITWRPKSWDKEHRMLVLRQRVAKPLHGPLQLDLFVPRDYEFDYRVIATNKTVNADAIRLFHHGRGTQEGLIGEAKTHAQLDYVPTRKLVANQLFLTATLMAHNLGRELQMTAQPRTRSTSPTRAALWEFENLGTLRNRLLHRAGRLTTPKGVLTLTLSENKVVQHDYEAYLRSIRVAA